jgi:hypothetical protein
MWAPYPGSSSMMAQSTNKKREREIVAEHKYGTFGKM